MGGRRRKSLRLFAAAALVALFAAAVRTAQPTGRQTAGRPVAAVPQVGYAVGFAVSPAVSDLPEQALSGAVEAGANATVPARPVSRGRRPATAASLVDG